MIMRRLVEKKMCVFVCVRYTRRVRQSKSGNSTHNEYKIAKFGHYSVIRIRRDRRCRRRVAMSSPDSRVREYTNPH